MACAGLVGQRHVQVEWVLAFYYVVRAGWPGAVWLLVVAVYVVAVPLVLMGTRALHSSEAARS